MVAIEAVASAVGSSEVGSWMKPMMAFGLLDVALGFAAATGGAAGAGEAAAEGDAAALGDAAAAGLGAVVVAAPLVVGDVGATAAGVLHAANNAEAIGSARPTWRRSARRASCTSLSYSPPMRTVLLPMVVAVVATLTLWHPARVAVQALLLLPALFPAAPVDPLSLFTAAPTQEHATYDYAAGTVDSQFILPATDAKHPATVLLLGAGDLPQEGLAVHFAQALARLGIVTEIPESSGMLSEHLTFEEVDGIRVAVHELAARSDVDQTRVGLIGLSASGGLGIVAATQPDLRDSVRFVNSFGSYDDALTLIVDVASQSMVVDGAQRNWTPEQRTIEVVGNALIDAGVPDQDRTELLGGATRERASDIVANFPTSARSRLEEVSPSSVLDQIKAHLYLMHDMDDPFIPFTESRQLVAAAPPDVVTRYTEFSIFEHVIPDRSVPWQTFLPDLWRLFWHVHAVLLELL